MKSTVKELTETLFLHRRTTSISLCFAAHSRTEQVSFYLSFNFHLQFSNKMSVPYFNTISNRYHSFLPPSAWHQRNPKDPLTLTWTACNSKRKRKYTYLMVQLMLSSAIWHLIYVGVQFCRLAIFSNLLACFRHSDRGGCEQEKQRAKGGGRGVRVNKRL